MKTRDNVELILRVALRHRVLYATCGIHMGLVKFKVMMVGGIVPTSRTARMVIVYAMGDITGEQQVRGVSRVIDEG
jgi:hypothetical protein